jgi:hypothetical protein
MASPSLYCFIFFMLGRGGWRKFLGLRRRLYSSFDHSKPPHQSASLYQENESGLSRAIPVAFGNLHGSMFLNRY